MKTQLLFYIERKTIIEYYSYAYEEGIYFLLIAEILPDDTVINLSVFEVPLIQVERRRKESVALLDNGNTTCSNG